MLPKPRSGFGLNDLLGGAAWDAATVADATHQDTALPETLPAAMPRGFTENLGAYRNRSPRERLRDGLHVATCRSDAVPVAATVPEEPLAGADPTRCDAVTEGTSRRTI